MFLRQHGSEVAVSKESRCLQSILCVEYNVYWTIASRLDEWQAPIYLLSVEFEGVFDILDRNAMCDMR